MDLTDFRNGTRARVHGPVGELEMRGVLYDPAVPWNMPDWARPLRVSVAEVLERLAELERAGCRSILFRLQCFGGHASAEDALCSALAAFSERGGRVVAYVDELAASAGCGPALAADVTLMAPGAHFVLHRPLLWDGATGAEIGAADPGCRAVLEARAAFLAERTRTPRELLADWLRRGPNDRGAPEHAILGALEAQMFGWVDGVGDLEEARTVARLAAGADGSGRVPRRVVAALPPRPAQGNEPLLLVDPAGLKIGQKVLKDTGSIVAHGQVSWADAFGITAGNNIASAAWFNDAGRGAQSGLQVNFATPIPGTFSTIVLQHIGNTTVHRWGFAYFVGSGDITGVRLLALNQNGGKVADLSASWWILDIVCVRGWLGL